MGKLCTHSSHIEQDCGKETIKCKNGECTATFHRDETSSHNLICDYVYINCDLCNVRILRKDRNLHRDECPKELVRCTQDCGDMVTREGLKHHLYNECVNRLYLCNYNMVGCPFTSKEEFLQKHLDELPYEHHIMLLKSVMNIQDNLTNQVTDLEKNSTKLSEDMDEVESLVNAIPHVTKIKEVEIDEIPQLTLPFMSSNSSKEVRKGPGPEVRNANGNLQRKRNRVDYIEDSEELELEIS